MSRVGNVSLRVLYLLQNSTIPDVAYRLELYRREGVSIEGFFTTRSAERKFAVHGATGHLLYSFKNAGAFRKYKDLPVDFEANSEVLGDKLLSQIRPDVAERIACDIFGRVEDFLRTVSFDGYMGEYNSFTAAVFFYFARKENKHFYWPYNSPVGGHFMMTSTPEKFALEREFKRIWNEESLEPLSLQLSMDGGAVKEYFDSNGSLPHMTKLPGAKVNKLHRLRERVLTFMDVLVWDRHSFEYTDYFFIATNKKITYWHHYLTRAFRSRLFCSDAEFSKYDLKKTVTYFLHHEPDLSLQVKAQEYFDQYYVLKNIAACLPNDWKLVIREHPLSKYTRATTFYRKLLKLPGVVLRGGDSDKDALINQTRVVITIRGTISIEAFMKGVAVINLGEHISGCLPGVRVAKGMEDLKFAVREAIDSKARFVSSDADRTRFCNVLGSFHRLGNWHASKNLHRSAPSDHRAVANRMVSLFGN